MTTFTESEAENQLRQLLDEARAQGQVRIKRADGQEFIVRPLNRSSLDVGYVDVSPALSADEIVSAVRESRERT